MLREKTGATPGISQKTATYRFPNPEKETETQKTNSIPFAKPIRRPMQLEGNHIAKEITSCSHYEPDNNWRKAGPHNHIAISHYDCDRSLRWF